MTDAAQIEQCARDYFTGWFTGDAALMDRALHPRLVKRSPHTDFDLERVTTKERMLELTRLGEGTTADDPGVEVDVVDVHAGIAAAVVRSSVYREYLHLAHTAEGWRIVHALWMPT